MSGPLKFAYEAPNQTTPNRMALKQTMRNQTKVCIAKSHEVRALVRYYTAQSGNSALTFQENLSGPASRVKKLKRENRVREKLTDTPCFWKPAPFPFSGNGAANLVGPSD